ncbi:MAG TPA: hypothetical protein VKG85_11710 [Actinomycetes bacterium]|nr:hypothetical protein [Actinomycetes bacterium]
MYGWIWRHLPGNTMVKFGCAVLIVAALIYVLFVYFFPWLDPRLPFNRVTVDEGMPPL